MFSEPRERSSEIILRNNDGRASAQRSDSALMEAPVCVAPGGESGGQKPCLLAPAGAQQILLSNCLQELGNTGS